MFGKAVLAVACCLGAASGAEATLHIGMDATVSVLSQTGAKASETALLGTSPFVSRIDMYFDNVGKIFGSATYYTGYFNITTPSANEGSTIQLILQNNEVQILSNFGGLTVPDPDFPPDVPPYGNSVERMLSFIASTPPTGSLTGIPEDVSAFGPFTGKFQFDLAYGTPASTTYGIAISAVTVDGTSPGRESGVPEPATWATMVGGFAIVGFSLRRRRTAVSFG